MRVAREIENDPPLSVPEAMARLGNWGGDLAELQIRCWEGDLAKTHSYISQHLRDFGDFRKGEWPRDGSNRKTRWAPVDWTSPAQARAGRAGRVSHRHPGGYAPYPPQEEPQAPEARHGRKREIRR